MSQLTSLKRVLLLSGKSHTKLNIMEQHLPQRSASETHLPLPLSLAYSPRSAMDSIIIEHEQN